ncbi:MAG: alpha/beta fold hydrolase, partial [Endozoicomonadaceae bacterium]|nr:alpha/beta fold hydrolase [Endozoicomonadaceae bacterium]
MNKIHTILLPGWGVSANIFNTLPDYDAAQKIDLLTLQGVHHDEYWLIKSLDKQIKKNQPLCIIGWSLGGLLATHYAACYPNQVQQLILLNSNPCFIRQHNWPGMAPFHFKTFFDQFNAEPRRTLKRFHNLCAKQDQSNKQKTIYHQLLRYQTIIPIQHSTEHQHWMRLLNYL